MKRLSLADPMPDALRGAIVALGNFDGFHLGHQAVVGRAIARGAHEGKPVIVATFDPHPVRLFRPDAPPFRLTSLDQREELFANAGADAMLVFHFTPALAATSAEEFVGDLLAHRLGASAVVTGDDFTFGKGRSGNVAVLAELAAKHGLSAEAVGAVSASAERISSGRVREALEAGEVGDAIRLLTRPFKVRGTVIHGDKRGRELGYPTANLEMGDYQRPKYGIYAVKVTLPDGRDLGGVASLGVRPMFDPPKELLEAHIFDFNEDIYGQQVDVALIGYIREERRFDDVNALIEQMDRDSAEARAVLGQR